MCVPFRPLVSQQEPGLGLRNGKKLRCLFMNRMRSDRMLRESCVPRIEVTFDNLVDANTTLYCSVIRHLLSIMLPKELFGHCETDPDALADQREHFRALLPLMHSS